MNSNLFPSSTTFLLIISISISILIQSPLLLSQQENHEYETCKKPFQCANLENIRYPFWAASRPSFCGRPGFELSCEGDVPVITILSIPYRVLNIDSDTYNLTVARQDLSIDLCPRNYMSTTLDTALFDYVSGDRNVTLHYGCTPNLGPTGLPNQINCPNLLSPSYFTTSDMPNFNFSWLMTCSHNITVPVTEPSYQDLTRPAASVSDLTAALTGGFGLQYFGENCSECVQSDGLCGHNLTTNLFTCYCEDGSRSLTCGNDENRTGSSSSKKARNIVVSVVGASLGVVVIVSLIFFCKQRRKQLATQGAQTNSDELLTIPSGRSRMPLSTATFTRSTPSYPSSISSLGKGSNYFGVQVFSYTELEQATDNFDPSRELGDGGFGTVYYGELNDGRIVAVKRHYDNNFKRVEQFMNEVQILTRLRHHNLVNLYGCTSRRSRELLLVYEYIPNGTVADHLHGKRSNSGFISWPTRMNIAVETANALAYLHTSAVIHRDVKTTNILLDNDFHVKVADFGLSRLFPNDATHVSTAPQGTPGYVDPEYFKSYKLTEKSDVYGFGVVLIELISSLKAVDTDRHKQDINLFNMAIDKIQNNTLHELVDPSLGFKTDSSVRRMTTSVAQVAFQCLQEESDMRPLMSEVLETLRVIQNEEVLNAQKEKMLDILGDDTVPLKDNAIPVSPDSVIPDDCVSSSTTHSSS